MNWLLAWKTWIEDEISPPWPWVVVEYTNDYKKRGYTGEKTPSALVEDVYLSFNPTRIADFEKQHIDAARLGALIQANDEHAAKLLVTSVFGDAEIDLCEPVPDHLLSDIMLLFKENGY
jgi:hypothetical protein